jgi:hypothetical protein
LLPYAHCQNRLKSADFEKGNISFGITQSAREKSRAEDVPALPSWPPYEDTLLAALSCFQVIHQNNLTHTDSIFGMRYLVPCLPIYILCFHQRATIFACFVYCQMKTRLRPYNASFATILCKNQVDELICTRLCPTYGATQARLCLCA